MRVTVLSHFAQRIPIVRKRRSLSVVAMPFANRTPGFKIAALLFMGLFAGGNSQLATAQQWFQLVPKTNPSPRYGQLMAYDGSNGTVVLYGGTNSKVEYLSDTWVWDGKDWTEMHPSNNPGPATGAGTNAMACEEAGGKVLLVNGNGSPYETWVWNGEDWTQEHPKNSPPVDTGSTMAYDPSNGLVVMFNTSGQTWVWNGTNWTNQNTKPQPPAREFSAMAYDASSRSVIMFGGVGIDSDKNLSDTWAWNGTSWAEEKLANSPPPSQQFSIASDQYGGVVLYGGAGYSGDGSDATWVYGAGSWDEGHPSHSPSARRFPGMVYDASTGDVVLFGGNSYKSYAYLSDTWVWAPKAPTQLDATAETSDPQEQ
jgi:hypothetical protein